MISALLVLLFTPQAQAYRPSLEPELRVHLGPSMVGGPYGWGGMFGLDTRLTHVLHVDLGATFSPISVPEDWNLSDELPASDYFLLRHSIFVTPGVRIPHPQPDKFTWDIYLRGGMAVAWSVDLSPPKGNDPPRRNELDPAGVGGLDVVLQGEHLGVRGVARVYGWKPFYNDELDDVVVFRPQFGIEGLWMF